jgi:hypothetical protein
LQPDLQPVQPFLRHLHFSFNHTPPADAKKFLLPSLQTLMNAVNSEKHQNSLILGDIEPMPRGIFTISFRAGSFGSPR